MILYIVFAVLMISVFGKLLALCLRAAWGITKILFRLVMLPIVLIGLAIGGAVWIAIILTVIIGVVALVIH